MSTPTPTGDAMNALPGWMPDEPTLTRMANEFFGALTVSEPAAQLPTPASDEPANQPVTALPVALPITDPLGYPSAGVLPGDLADATRPGGLTAASAPSLQPYSLAPPGNDSSSSQSSCRTLAMPVRRPSTSSTNRRHPPRR